MLSAPFVVLLCSATSCCRRRKNPVLLVAISFHPVPTRQAVIHGTRTQEVSQGQHRAVGGTDGSPRGTGPCSLNSTVCKGLSKQNPWEILSLPMPMVSQQESLGPQSFLPPEKASQPRRTREGSWELLSIHGRSLVPRLQPSAWARNYFY